MVALLSWILNPIQIFPSYVLSPVLSYPRWESFRHFPIACLWIWAACVAFLNGSSQDPCDIWDAARPWLERVPWGGIGGIGGWLVLRHHLSYQCRIQISPHLHYLALRVPSREPYEVVIEMKSWELVSFIIAASESTYHCSWRPLPKFPAPTILHRILLRYWGSSYYEGLSHSRSCQDEQRCSRRRRSCWSTCPPVGECPARSNRHRRPHWRKRWNSRRWQVHGRVARCDCAVRMYNWCLLQRSQGTWEREVWRAGKQSRDASERSVIINLTKVSKGMTGKLGRWV